MVGTSVREGWLRLREVMRGWGISNPEDLTGWLRRHGFQGASPGHHISGNAQEFLLGQACAVDGRVALLEAVHVQLAMHWGRHVGPRQVQHPPPRSTGGRARLRPIRLGPAGSFELGPFDFGQWGLIRLRPKKISHRYFFDSGQSSPPSPARMLNLVHISGPRFSPPKFHERTPKRGKKE